MAYGLQPVMQFRRGRFVAADWSQPRWFGVAGYTPDRINLGTPFGSDIEKFARTVARYAADVFVDACPEPGADSFRGLMMPPARLLIRGLGSRTRLEFRLRGNVVVGDCDNTLGQLVSNRIMPPIPHEMFYRAEFAGEQWRQEWGTGDEEVSWRFPVWREYVKPPEPDLPVELQSELVGEYLERPFSTAELFSRARRWIPNGL